MKFNTQLSLLTGAVAIGLAGMTSASAAVPAEGTNITNYATATYKVPGNDETIETQSNTVKITVGKAPSFTLIQDNDTTINKDTGKVIFKHTIKNTGNTDGTYNLTAENADKDNFDYNDITIYLDDGNGQPTGKPIQSIDVPKGESKKFVVVAQKNGTKVDKEFGTVTVTATSTDTNVTKKNTDIGRFAVSNLLIAKTAKLTVDKYSDGKANINDEITYTIKYGNTGSVDSENNLIVDKLPTGVKYIAGSAKLDNASVTDSDDTDSFIYDSNTNTVLVKVGTVAKNTNNTDNPAGTLTFKVKVTDESKDIVNTAKIGEDKNGDNELDNPSDASSDDATVDNSTTTVKGTINESPTDKYSDSEKEPNNVDKDNKIIKEVIITNTTSDSATSSVNNGQLQSETVTFTTYVHNTGNIAADFNLELDDSVARSGELQNITFTPIGSSDGTTGNATTTGTTGVIQPGNKQKVRVTATIPKGTKLKDNTDYSFVLKTTPTDGGKSDTIELIVNAQKALEVIKKQAKVTPSATQACSDIKPATLTYSDAVIDNVKVGDCIFYEITATNYYPKGLTEVVLKDTLDQSVLDNTSEISGAMSSTYGTASFNSPTITTTEFDLPPNEKAVLRFGREVNKQ